jgi:hypothetical protein
MRKRLKEQYLLLSNGKKLLVLFLLQWTYWVAAMAAMEKFWPGDSPLTTGQLIVKGTFMAVWMTIIFHWKKVKILFLLELNNDLRSLELLPGGNYENHASLLHALAAVINHIADSDFNRLIQVLYKVDIPEKKLKQLLAGNYTDAGELIGGLIIERLLQKIESRKQFKRNTDIPGDEKW